MSWKRQIFARRKKPASSSQLHNTLHSVVLSFTDFQGVKAHQVQPQQLHGFSDDAILVQRRRFG
jgi:hypothetical protein